MSALIYIGCCMTIAFVVGLVMGIRIGYVMAYERAEQELGVIANKYLELTRALKQGAINGR